MINVALDPAGDPATGTNNWSVLQNAFDASPNETFYIARGRYLIITPNPTTQLSVRGNVRIVGDGRDQTVFHFARMRPRLIKSALQWVLTDTPRLRTSR